MILPAFTNLPNLVTGVQPFSSSLLPLFGPPRLLLRPKDLFGASVGADMSEYYVENRGSGFRSTMKKNGEKLDFREGSQKARARARDGGRSIT